MEIARILQQIQGTYWLVWVCWSKAFKLTFSFYWKIIVILLYSHLRPGYYVQCLTVMYCIYPVCAVFLHNNNYWICTSQLALDNYPEDFIVHIFNTFIRIQCGDSLILHQLLVDSWIRKCNTFLVFFFIQKKGIPLPVTPKKPWSMDANLMHIRLVNIVRLKLTEI